MSGADRSAVLEPLRQALGPLAHHGRTSSVLLVAALADGAADTEAVLAVVRAHLSKTDRDPALVTGLQRLLIEDEARDTTGADPLCDECGEPFQVKDGTSTHLDEHGGTDHDADADHVPYRNG